jgi:putative heme iron utilization protein
MTQDDMSRAVRDLVRGLDRAALATALPVDAGAWPYASLVLVAVDHDLSPLLLLSDLAEHTKAIAGDGRRFLARHPDAEIYAGFKDFHLYRVAVERAHLVAGFGKIRWLSAEELEAAPASGLAESEADIVAHMNEDHADALQLYAGRLLGLPGNDWRMTGIDAEGIDLRRNGEVARLAFDAPLAAASEARKILVSLVAKARAVDAAP